jgi:hypothetical protein
VKKLAVRQGVVTFGVEPGPPGKVILTKQVDGDDSSLPFVIDISALSTLVRWIQLQRDVAEMDGTFNS